MGKTKRNTRTETTLQRIGEQSRKCPKSEFKWLMPHFNEESLERCYHELDGKKAVGVDGITKEEYGKNLKENIRDLISMMVPSREIEASNDLQRMEEESAPLE